MKRQDWGSNLMSDRYIATIGNHFGIGIDLTLANKEEIFLVSLVPTVFVMRAICSGVTVRSG